VGKVRGCATCPQIASDQATCGTHVVSLSHLPKSTCATRLGQSSRFSSFDVRHFPESLKSKYNPYLLIEHTESKKNIANIVNFKNTQRQRTEARAARQMERIKQISKSQAV
jgi:hypothetical protein